MSVIATCLSTITCPLFVIVREIPRLNPSVIAHILFHYNLSAFCDSARNSSSKSERDGHMLVHDILSAFTSSLGQVAYPDEAFERATGVGLEGGAEPRNDTDQRTMHIENRGHCPRRVYRGSSDVSLDGRRPHDASLRNGQLGAVRICGSERCGSIFWVFDADVATLPAMPRNGRDVRVGSARWPAARSTLYAQPMGADRQGFAARRGDRSGYRASAWRQQERREQVVDAFGQAYDDKQRGRYCPGRRGPCRVSSEF